MQLLLYAVAPVFAIIWYIYWQDRHEKEPFGVLFRCFILGAIFSVLLTLGLYLIFGKLIPLTNRFSVLQQFVQAFFVVALIEEFSKYIIVRYVAIK